MENEYVQLMMPWRLIIMERQSPIDRLEYIGLNYTQRCLELAAYILHSNRIKINWHGLLSTAHQYRYTPTQSRV